MTSGEKIAQLRKSHGHTQEQLAAQLGVSRQAVSRWESGLAYPETDKLIRLSELYDCTLDYLLRDQPAQPVSAPAPQPVSQTKRRRAPRTSQRMIGNLPLWQIGRNARAVVAVGLNARGVIAVGLKAVGLIACGTLSIGVFSLGLLGLGLFSAGLAAVGLCASGCFSAGLLAVGAISWGVFSLGAVAMGDFSAGALAIGKYVAIGDDARGMIALGQTHASGQLYQSVGTLTAQELETVRRLIDSVTPARLSWAAALIKVFL